jgi:GNAT superfamily N-acetyltransferase
MTLAVNDLWRLVGDGLALCMRGARNYAARLTPDAALALSGEAVADLNYAVIGSGPAPEARLREFSHAITTDRLPIVLILAPEVTQPLASLAQDMGFRHVGSMPLMIHEAPLAPAAEATYQVARVADADTLREANAVAARAFALPEDAAQRAFGPPLLAAPGVELFLARQGSTPVSSVQTTRFGASVGIWTMATLPQHQRKGAGRALLQQVMQHHRDGGATLFYLCATQAGYPLYERLGFHTVSQCAVWVAGQSTQVPG